MQRSKTAPKGAAIFIANCLARDSYLLTTPGGCTSQLACNRVGLTRGLDLSFHPASTRIPVRSADRSLDLARVIDMELFLPKLVVEGRFQTVQQKQGFATGISRPLPAQHEDVPGAAGPEVQQKQGFATGISLPQPAQHEDVPGAAGPEVQQKQGFATGISLPQPAQHEDVPGAAGPEVQQKQAFATGISRPQPAQHEDVPGAAGPEVQQKQAFATGISRPQPAQHEFC